MIYKLQNGRTIPIVKRDNFHNPDLRFKQDGTINRFRNILKK